MGNKGFFSAVLAVLAIALFMLVYTINTTFYNGYVPDDSLRFAALKTEEAYFFIDKNITNLQKGSEFNCNTFSDIIMMSQSTTYQDEFCKAEISLLPIHTGTNKIDANYLASLNCSFDGSAITYHKDFVFRRSFELTNHNDCNCNIVIKDLDADTDADTISLHC